MVVLPDRSQPGRARDLQLLDEPEPRPAARRERRQPGRNAVLAHAGSGGDPLRLRRDPLHLPSGAPRRHRRHRLRRPRAAADPPRAARERILASPPRARHGAPPDGRALVGELRALRRPARRARRGDRGRLPDRHGARAGSPTPVRRLHELRPCRPPRLLAARPGAPRLRPRASWRRAPPGLRGGRRRLRPADRGGGVALRRAAHRHRPLRPRHEADLLDVPREPLARGGRPPPLPPPLSAAPQGHGPERSREGRSAARAHGPAGTDAQPTSCPGCPRPAADRAFADIDFGSTRAYCFATGGQIYLGEASGAREDPRYADRLAEELAAIPHPETGDPAFDVLRKEELYHGPYLDKAPELVLLPRDERIHVDSIATALAGPLSSVHDTLDPSVLLRLFGPPRPDRDPRRRRSRHPIRPRAAGERDRPAPRHPAAPPRPRRAGPRRRADRGDPGRPPGSRPRRPRRRTPAEKPYERLQRRRGAEAASSTSATSATSSAPPHFAPRARKPR